MHRAFIVQSMFRTKLQVFIVIRTLYIARIIYTVNVALITYNS